MSGWQKVIGWGYNLLFILVPLIWLPNTSELFEFNKIIFTYILTIIIVGAWMARCITEQKIIFKRTLLDAPICLFLLINLISLIFSIDLHTSWYGYYSRWNGGLLSLISYSLLYWAFVSNMNKKSSLFTVNCSLITAALIAIYGGLEHFGFSPSCLLTRGQWGVDCWVQDVQNRVFATLGQPNWMAAYLVALIWIPISDLMFKVQDSRFNKLKNLSIFILLFLALLFTKSRSGLLAFGVSSVIYWGVLFMKHKSKIINQFFAYSLLLLLFTIIIPNPLRDLVSRTQNLAPRTSSATQLEVGGTESGAIRKIVWTGALRIWQANGKNFWIGTGPETFAESYYQYRPIEHNQTSEWELLYNKAHNEYLNYLSTTGLLGLASYLLLLGFMGWVLVKFQIPNSKSQINLKKTKIQNWNLENSLRFENWVLRLALFAGWSSIVVTNFWGFSVVITQLFLFLFPAIAIVLNEKS